MGQSLYVNQLLNNAEYLSDRINTIDTLHRDQREFLIECQSDLDKTQTRRQLIQWIGLLLLFILGIITILVKIFVPATIMNARSLSQFYAIIVGLFFTSNIPMLLWVWVTNQLHNDISQRYKRELDFLNELSNELTFLRSKHTQLTSGSSA